MRGPDSEWSWRASAEPVGVGVALAAILVQAPRLVLAMLAADRQPVAAEAERGLLVVEGVGTALVLTGGNLYLAHALARVRALIASLAPAVASALPCWHARRRVAAGSSSQRLQGAGIFGTVRRGGSGWLPPECSSEPGARC